MVDFGISALYLDFTELDRNLGCDAGHADGSLCVSGGRVDRPNARGGGKSLDVSQPRSRFGIWLFIQIIYVSDFDGISICSMDRAEIWAKNPFGCKRFPDVRFAIHLVDLYENKQIHHR